MKKVNPPRWAEAFFSWFCHLNHLEGLEGDLYESFERRIMEKGKFRARMAYVIEVLTLLRPSVSRKFFKNSNHTRMDLIKNYLVSSFRFAKRKIGFTIINLFGLVLGFTSVLLISVYVHHELTYDQQIPDRERVYRVYNERVTMDGVFERYNAIVPPAFASSFQENFPQIESTGRILKLYNGNTFTVGDRSFLEKNGIHAELSTLEMLGFRIKHGNLSALSTPNAVLVSESLYQKLFGNEPFESPTVLMGGHSMDIVGVFHDMPDKSHLKPDYIFSWELLEVYVSEDRMNSWIWQQFFTYIKLIPGTDEKLLFADIQKFIEEKSRPFTDPHGMRYIPHFQEAKDIHLKSYNFHHDIADVGNYQAIIFLTLAAFIILVIACFNYVNLSVAQTISKSKDMGVRKLIGAKRQQLVTQHLSESLLFSFVAGAISIFLAWLVLPFMIDFTAKAIDRHHLFNPWLLLTYLSTISALGMLTGWYPTMVILRSKGLDVMKSSKIPTLRYPAWRWLNIKNLLIIGQYVLCLTLIVVAMVVNRQYAYLQNKDMGFDRENLLVIKMTPGMRNDLSTVKSEFLNHPNVLNASFSYGTPGGLVAGDGIILPRKGPDNVSTRLFMIDEDYVSTLGMKIIAGRDFSAEIRDERRTGFLINEAAVDDFGFDSPEDALNEPVHWKMWTENDSTKKGKIIGVVQDFNFVSLHSAIQPAVLLIEPDFTSNLIIRIGDGDFSETMAFLASTFEQYASGRSMDLTFVDSSFDEMYKSEHRLSVLFSIFTGIAIFSACIGLLGLISFQVANRTKEISIRKVLGADATSLIALLGRDYLVIIGVSLLLAFPLAHKIIEQWLENFAYAIEPGVLLFAQVAMIMVILTVAVLAYHLIQGIRASPAQRLRTE